MTASATLLIHTSDAETSTGLGATVNLWTASALSSTVSGGLFGKLIGITVFWENLDRTTGDETYQALFQVSQDGTNFGNWIIGSAEIADGVYYYGPAAGAPTDAIQYCRAGWILANTTPIGDITMHAHFASVHNL